MKKIIFAACMLATSIVAADCQQIQEWGSKTYWHVCTNPRCRGQRFYVEELWRRMVWIDNYGETWKAWPWSFYSATHCPSCGRPPFWEGAGHGPQPESAVK